MIESQFTLSSIEKDTIGEIMNISMGSAATALSTMLSRKVSITAPEVKDVTIEDYNFDVLIPSVCAEVRYVEGLDGSNFMIMKMPDVKSIVRILTNMDIPSDGDILDEMHISAVGEIMNQMMGSSSTALANFFGHNINISIPEVFEVDVLKEKIKDLNMDSFVMVKFRFTIEEVLDSEVFSLLPLEFTKELVGKMLNGSSSSKSKENSEGAKSSSKPEPSSKSQVRKMSEKKNQENPVNVKPLKLSNFEEEQVPASREYSQPSFDLIMDVPLEITVEIGHARKLVKEILEIQQGHIIELDKQAGDPVDIIVNGQLLARGDVVVVDDNFGVRITEIVSKKDLLEP